MPSERLAFNALKTLVLFREKRRADEPQATYSPKVSLFCGFSISLIDTRYPLAMAATPKREILY